VNELIKTINVKIKTYEDEEAGETVTDSEPRADTDIDRASRADGV